MIHHFLPSKRGGGGGGEGEIGSLKVLAIIQNEHPKLLDCSSHIFFQVVIDQKPYSGREEEGVCPGGGGGVRRVTGEGRYECYCSFSNLGELWR